MENCLISKFELFTVRGLTIDTSSVPDLPLSLQLDDGTEEESPDGEQAEIVGEGEQWRQ